MVSVSTPQVKDEGLYVHVCDIVLWKLSHLVSETLITNLNKIWPPGKNMPTKPPRPHTLLLSCVTIASVNTVQWSGFVHISQCIHKPMALSIQDLNRGRYSPCHYTWCFFTEHHKWCPPMCRVINTHARHTHTQRRTLTHSQSSRPRAKRSSWSHP